MLPPTPFPFAQGLALPVSVAHGLRGYLPSFLILNFAPLAPQLWGKSQFASKVPRPPNPPSEQSLAWGELADASLFYRWGGGLDVANGTSQTTS
ncbi:hypothetical protein BJP34_32380 [Moorena producens PAL-8-15-08-1]|uniref:Uncharacterized protein n=1 Tax=Moorena producens PAL-8-15-08-1 TaxID=1458985 RepID=A0A1D8U0Z1_9CYAN|nr:hypothetical protein BJP34_32380 [Moorena producens PAL-8-15-08-1]